MKVSVKCLAGMESILAEEMRNLGAGEVEEGNRIVFAEVDMEWVYRANLCLRTALRILIPFKTFRARKPEHLYHKIKKIWWGDRLTLKDTFAINCTAHSNFFTHSKFAALKAKDAIADWFRMHQGGFRPSVDTVKPDYLYNLHIQDDVCTLSLDTSGRSLHLRGYRVQVGDAPINEVLAAGIIHLTGWKHDQPFVNPMCGSGTFMIEAALMAQNRSPQIDQEFGFHRWSTFEEDLWKKALEYERDHRKDVKFDISGSDKDPEALRFSRINLEKAGLYDQVEVTKKDFFKSKLEEKDAIVMLNPPYDMRLAEKDVDLFYQAIGDQLKHEYSGNTAWMITGNLQALKKLGLRTESRTQLWNGSIECRLLKYSLYSGSRKKSK